MLIVRLIPFIHALVLVGGVTNIIIIQNMFSIVRLATQHIHTHSHTFVLYSVPTIPVILVVESGNAYLINRAGIRICTEQREIAPHRLC